MEELNVLEAKQTVERKQVGAKESKRSYWLNRVREFDKSGLTQRKFCELHGLRPNALSRWKNRFKKPKGKFLKESQEGKLTCEAKNQESVNFLSLELSDETKLGKKVYSDKIVFRHESGITLELEESSNKGLFRSGLLMLLELTRC
jgi:transcriptional regulator with XRE-family HTH domain